jgi:hypothetical protein
MIEHLDHLSFDEAWIGEHHSGATEIYASPEIMIAAAADRTPPNPKALGETWDWVVLTSGGPYGQAY